MKNYQLSIINYQLTIILSALMFYACETAEDISLGMDHEVPSYQVLTDSLVVHPGQTVEIKVNVTDNAGLSKLVFAYGNWLLRESVTLDELNYPLSYSFTTSLTIPEDAEKEWEEDFVQNNGATLKIVQQYHKLILEATDVNKNVRNIPVYIKVE
jgi:hypothetical protein